MPNATEDSMIDETLNEEQFAKLKGSLSDWVELTQFRNDWFVDGFP